MMEGIWKKVTDGGTLEATDLNSEEKKRLYAIFEEHGMPVSSCYNRFFNKGFDIWEIKGVTKLKSLFLQQEICGTDNNQSGEEGSRGYGYVLTLSDKYDDSMFYKVVTDLKIGVKLCDFMAKRGMTSQMTVRSRFKADDWKPWELKGVEAIIKEMLLEDNIDNS